MPLRLACYLSYSQRTKVLDCLPAISKVIGVAILPTAYRFAIMLAIGASADLCAI